MPLGAAQAASIEERMRSECNKESGENLYSTGFVRSSADDTDPRTHLDLLPRFLSGIDRNLERDPQSKARAVSQGQSKMSRLNHEIAGNPRLFVVERHEFSNRAGGVIPSLRRSPPAAHELGLHFGEIHRAGDRAGDQIRSQFLRP